MITNEHIQEFLAQAHRVGDARLTICSSGNLSWRIGEEALVSGTGSWVPSLQAEKVSICNIATGEVKNGVKPSMESGFHLGILRERPDVNVVLHFQSDQSRTGGMRKQLRSGIRKSHVLRNGLPHHCAVAWRLFCTHTTGN